jgi:site-specific recombinase XerD
MDESLVQKAVKDVVRRSGITKQASCHTFRHSFATEKYRRDHDIRKVQLQLGHKGIPTTLIYTHNTENVSEDEWSPLDEL